MPATAGISGPRAWLEALLQRHWWQPRPSLLSRLLQPLSWLYRALSGAHRHCVERRFAPVPVLVVGNVVVGGAGKTPTVLAAVRLLQAAGHNPAVLSRGYGRQGRQAWRVQSGDTPALVGDEPLLLHRKSGVDVWVGADRAALAQRACAHDPGVDVLVSDDGLQHHGLGRTVNLVVFDERGVGNGLLLPAGPLRQRWPMAASDVPCRVLYNAAAASTPVPGALAARSISRAWPLHAWWQNDATESVPLTRLQGRPLVAAAGLAAPEKFFSMLEATGLQIKRLPLPDHHAFETLPWPTGTPEVVITEKDAVKLRAPQPASQAAPGSGPATAVWVVPLDFEIPADLGHQLLALLFPERKTP